MRRTSGTLFRANSDNEQAVADHMGHENFKITRKFYIDPTKAYPDRVYASDVLPRIGERRPLAGESGT